MVYPRQQRMQREAEEAECLKQEAEVAVLVEDPALRDARAAIAAREEELSARTYELDAKEARLDAAALKNEDGPVAAAQWAALAAERQLLAGRWMCLAEDKKALAVLERRAARSSGGGGGGDDPEPFEPGSLPIRDVRCAIIAHQVDIPLSSCCFQR